MGHKRVPYSNTSSREAVRTRVVVPNRYSVVATKIVLATVVPTEIGSPAERPHPDADP
jgi:hypothetical protein